MYSIYLNSTFTYIYVHACTTFNLHDRAAEQRGMNSNMKVSWTRYCFPLVASTHFSFCNLPQAKKFERTNCSIASCRGFKRGDPQSPGV